MKPKMDVYRDMSFSSLLENLLFYIWRMKMEIHGKKLPFAAAD